MNQFEEAAAKCVAAIRESKSEGREIVQLPLWDEDQRGAPSAVLRSALFGVIKRGNREAVERQLLAAWAGNEIRYTGFRLDQGDLDCWLQVLHVARQFPLGKDVRFTARGFLRTIGRSGGGKDQAWLQRSLGRMQACGVFIRSASGQGYQGSLIQNFFVDEESGRYVVSLDPLVATLFDEAFVKLSMEKRLLLGSDLSRWLHGYVQSHKATKVHPHRVGLGQLRELCGSDSKHMTSFRQKLRAAMSELQSQNIVMSWRITDGDALEFARP